MEYFALSLFLFGGRERVLSLLKQKKVGENRDKISERNNLYYQYAAHYILKISELNKSFCENVDMSACIPFAEFTHNIKEGNKEIIETIRKVN